MLLKRALTIGALAFAPGVVLGGTYHITDLGDLGGIFSSGLGVNSSGQVVGNYGKSLADSTHAFVYSGGVAHDINGGSVVSAKGINEVGQVVGTAGGQAYVYSNGTLTKLGVLASFGPNDPGHSEGLGINRQGTVVGTSTNADGYARAFVSSNGLMLDLGGIGGGASYGMGINDSGQVTGSADVNGFLHAFLYSNGVMTDITSSLGANQSEGTSINNWGQIAGDEDSTGSRQAFLYSNGAFTRLGNLYGGETFSKSINNHGQVVGYEWQGNGTNTPFLYSGGSMVDLNSLLDASGKGWNLTLASGISDNGYITGTGVIGGKYHAFLLTPDSVPEPASMFVVGLGLVALVRRRRNG